MQNAVWAKFGCANCNLQLESGGQSECITGVAHWTWINDFLYFFPCAGVTPTTFNSKFNVGDVLTVSYPAIPAKADNLALAVVCDGGAEISVSAKRSFTLAASVPSGRAARGSLRHGAARFGLLLRRGTAPLTAAVATRAGGRDRPPRATWWRPRRRRDLSPLNIHVALRGGAATRLHGLSTSPTRAPRTMTALGRARRRAGTETRRYGITDSRDRVRLGSSSRDYTVWTINGINRHVYSGGSLLTRQFFATGDYAGMDARVSPLVANTTIQQQNPHTPAGSAVALFSDGSIVGAGLVDGACGATPSCTGQTTPGFDHAGYGLVPLFAIKCGATSYVGSDPSAGGAKHRRGRRLVSGRSGAAAATGGSIRAAAAPDPASDRS